MSDRHYWVNLLSWGREGESGFLEGEFCTLWPRSCASGCFHPCEVLQRHNYGFCTALLFIVTSISHKTWGNCIYSFEMVKSLTTKQVHSAHLHSHLAVFSDLLEFTIFMLSYRSLTYKFTIFPQKWTIVSFSAKTTQAKGIPDVWDFITLTSFVGQSPIPHCP